MSEDLSARRTRRLAMTAIGMLIACLVAALPPAQASAKKKRPGLGPVVTVAATGATVSTPGQLSTAMARCPRRLQAVGGGFSAPFASDRALVVTESYRSDRHTWQVAGTLVGGSGPATAYAYCRRKTLSITDHAATEMLASGPGETVLVEADCGPKSAAVGGGFQMSSGPIPAHLPIPEQSIGGGPAPGGTPPLGNWRVVAQNSNTGAQTITAHVYCATGIKVPAFTQNQGSASVPLFGSVTQTSVCPPALKRKKGKRRKPKRLLSAGGFYSPFTPGTAVLPVHTDSRIVGKGFIDTAVNGSAGAGTLTVQSQAMCF